MKVAVSKSVIFDIHLIQQDGKEPIRISYWKGEPQVVSFGPDFTEMGNAQKWLDSQTKDFLVAYSKATDEAKEVQS